MAKSENTPHFHKPILRSQTKSLRGGQSFQDDENKEKEAAAKEAGKQAAKATAAAKVAATLERKRKKAEVAEIKAEKAKLKAERAQNLAAEANRKVAKSAKSKKKVRTQIPDEDEYFDHEIIYHEESSPLKQSREQAASIGVVNYANPRDLVTPSVTNEFKAFLESFRTELRDAVVSAVTTSTASNLALAASAFGAKSSTGICNSIGNTSPTSKVPSTSSVGTSTAVENTAATSIIVPANSSTGASNAPVGSAITAPHVHINALTGAISAADSIAAGVARTFVFSPDRRTQVVWLH